jgi:hypothetical protein
MEIRRHASCTRDIGAPSDMQDGSCSALPVAEVWDKSGIWSQSFWKPDEAELAALNSGGAVVLGLRAVGRQHPVVWVGVTPDKTEAL